MLVQAFHLVAQLFPAWGLGHLSAAAWRQRLMRGGRPDRFIRDIPQVSEQWLADHRRTTGKDGDRP
jgi:hypothetical protein